MPQRSACRVMAAALRYGPPQVVGPQAREFLPRRGATDARHRQGRSTRDQVEGSVARLIPSAIRVGQTIVVCGLSSPTAQSAEPHEKGHASSVVIIAQRRFFDPVFALIDPARIGHLPTYRALYFS